MGYGVIPIWEPARRTQFAFDGVRRSGTSIIIGLYNADVHYNQNRNGVGTGSGLCFGDSGSPQLDRGTLLVLSVTSGATGSATRTTRTIASTRRWPGRSSANSS